MKKTILDDDCRKMLLDNLKELGFENANKIVSEKYEQAVYESALEILERFLSLFKEKKYQQAFDMMRFSPAGDCMGTECYYLNFSEIGFSDIADVMYFLSHNKLKNYSLL